ncbi:unnamed protein product [Linum trigynum]|uniref:Uncharacterized protein n=1 Tax=Linum trigynum TaxID=586398 RepID=A0AAV2CUV9_9ROSI
MPPACFTNSAGDKKLPWQTHIILTSSPLPYLYRMPSTRLPFGPSPIVNTQGMSSMALVVPASLPLLSPEEEAPGLLWLFSWSGTAALVDFSVVGLGTEEHPGRFR